MGGKAVAVVTITADFGGHYAGIIAGVVKSVAPSAEVMVLSTEVKPFDIKGGAFMLLSSYKYFPSGTIHLAVVDPGVGSARKAVAIKTRNYMFVGPDNGLLSLAAEDDGAEAVYEISGMRLPAGNKETSATFHGRDIFAPAAGYLANGGSIEWIGARLGGYQRVAFAKTTGERSITGEVIYVDRFGNLTLSISEKDVELEGDIAVVIGGKQYGARRAPTYAEGGRGLSLLVGSAGFYEIAVKEGSAERVTGASSGDTVTITRV